MYLKLIIELVDYQLNKALLCKAIIYVILKKGLTIMSEFTYEENKTGDLNLVRKLEAEILGFYGSYSVTYPRIIGNKKDIIQAMDSSICREKLDAEEDRVDKLVDNNSACNEESTISDDTNDTDMACSVKPTISNDTNDTGMACSVKTLARKYDISPYSIRNAVHKGELVNVCGKKNNFTIYENHLIRYLKNNPKIKERRKKKKKGKANKK